MEWLKNRIELIERIKKLEEENSRLKQEAEKLNREQKLLRQWQNLWGYDGSPQEKPQEG